jgi:type IX secretion system PorP/SprF family membrane protein
MKRLILYVVLQISALCGKGQLPVYSLYHTNPLPVNPALTGSAHQLRSGLNFRNQWSNSPNPIVGYSAFIDHFIAPIRAGIGASVYSDVSGNTNFRSTQIGLYYAHTVKLTKKTYLKAGIQPAFGMVGYSGHNLLFNDQLSSTGNTGNATSETLPLGNTVSYFNLNSGLLLTVNQFWLGATAYNLLNPKAGISNESKLPTGFGVQTGVKIDFMANQISRKEKQERFLMPHLYFSSVGHSQQLYAGTHLVYEPFCVGIVVRGSFFSKINGIQNVASTAFNIGFRKKNVHFNYAYDLPISDKSRMLGPSHELSIQTLLKVGRKPSRRPYERLDLF